MTDDQPDPPFDDNQTEAERIQEQEDLAQTSLKIAYREFYNIHSTMGDMRFWAQVGERAAHELGRDADERFFRQWLDKNPPTR